MSDSSAVFPIRMATVGQISPTSIAPFHRLCNPSARAMKGRCPAFALGPRQSGGLGSSIIDGAQAPQMRLPRQSLRNGL